jgi:hypothetical protein
MVDYAVAILVSKGNGIRNSMRHLERVDIDRITARLTYTTVTGVYG